MEYSIHELSRLAGVSTRTLRYYDQIGLLRPRRVNDAGCRIYGSAEADILWQILFYRRLSLPLSAIREMLEEPSYDRTAALKTHLCGLQQKRRELDLLIQSVQKVLTQEEGGVPMNDHEKFEALKQGLIAENEQQYGEELRSLYGEENVRQSEQKLMGLTREAYDAMKALEEEILNRVQQAVTAGEDSAGETGAALARLHQQWLSYTWPQYSRQAHVGLVQLYTQDERFTAYYDRKVPGCAAFLRDAVTAAFR